MSGTTAKLKPFLKWAGGKGQLLPAIRGIYPTGLGQAITKYAEPFVGGGAVLVDILNTYDLEEVYVSDRNGELINAYLAIRDHVEDLCRELAALERTYLGRDAEGRRQYYYQVRETFNRLKSEGGLPARRAAAMIFLNRTCFNGLYRVNRRGEFNVPAGAYRNPQILDADNLLALSKAFARLRIVHGDYRLSAPFMDERTFAYFDPPYRPLTSTSAFTSYTEDAFSDENQRELAAFVRNVCRAQGALAAVSNSDPHNVDESDDFFDALYRDCVIRRIDAVRAINVRAEGRGKIKELLITTYGAAEGRFPPRPEAGSMP